MTISAATAEMTIQERYEHYIEVEGWSYCPDPTTWTGGCWWHDDRGSVNNGGGTFPTIARAVEAMDRHYRAFERMS